jgi:ABC-type Fe3+/spermidine/putrescine transport system ATPase subunit
VADVVLRLKGVTKRFGGFTALDDLSLDIVEGEILTLLGPSGCGKTTSLRIMAGLETPDVGDVFLRERPLVSISRGIFVSPHKRNMGMVFQSYAIWPHMSVFDNVAYPLRVRRVKHKQLHAQVMRTLELVGLAGLEHRQGPQLSGGQQQRVALARALVFEPGVLLMDEPFSNRDANLREQMRTQLRVLLKRIPDITVVFVTHDQAEALSLSVRSAVMTRGRIEQLGTPRRVYEHPATPFARDFLGRTIVVKGRIVGSISAKELCVQVGTPGNGPTLTAVANGHQFPEGTDVCLCIRPEDVEVVIANPANQQARSNDLLGTVESTSFVGDHLDCRVRIGEHATLSLSLPRSMVVADGTGVLLRITPSAASVWPV